jgi:hypothetical protein
VNHDDPIRRLATITDERAARTVRPGTRADLAEQIMATAQQDAPARRRRVLLFGVPLAAAAAAAAAVVVPGLSSPHKADVRLAALSFSTQGKYLVVKVRDPYADPKRYAKEFAAHHINVRLRLVPASPSIVGTVVAMEGGEGIQTITAKGECWSGGGGYACPVGVRIPLGYHREASVVFGRPARPGEQYNSTTSAFAAGEALHCVDVRGRTVPEALALLRRHKVTPAVFNYEARPGWFENTADRKKIPDAWYVTDAEPWAAGQVQLFVQPRKPRHLNFQRLFEGCR